MGVALGLLAVYMAAEIVGGIASNSLALLADAGHMFSDAAALGLALIASRLTRRRADARRTYGYHRAEILAALVNGASLLAISGYIVFEAISRLAHPSSVEGPLMMAVAGGGLVVNVAVLWLLHRDRAESLSHAGAWLHAFSDALGSVQVLLAGVGILVWGAYWLDPVASLLVAGLVVRSAWNLVKESMSVLFESVPKHLDSDEILVAVRSVQGVESVHDLHVWTIGTGFDALSAHVRSDCRRPRGELLRGVQDILRDRFGLEHVTIQVEDEQCRWEAPPGAGAPTPGTVSAASGADVDPAIRTSSIAPDSTPSGTSMKTDRGGGA